MHPIKPVRRIARVLFAHTMLGLVALAGGGCATVYGPSLTTDTASIRGIGPDGVHVTVRLSAYNHNDFALVIDEMNARVFLGGTDLGVASVTQRWALPGQASTPIEAELVVPYRALPSLLLGTLLDGHVPYRVVGEVSLEDTPITVAFEYEGQVDRSMLVGAALGSPGGSPGGSPSSTSGAALGSTP